MSRLAVPLFFGLWLAGAIGLRAAPASAAEARLAAARVEIEASRFPEALRQIDTVLAVEPAHFEARLMRARIHSWQGRYPEASGELAVLRREAPRNADVRMAQASLLYYQGRSREAAEAFRNILRADPANRDARAGYENAVRALADSPRPWRADAGVEHSYFTRRPQAPWNHGFLQVGRFVTDPTFVYARVEGFRQFENTDAGLEAGVSHRFSEWLYASAATGWIPDSDFKPAWRAAGDGGFRLYASEPADIRLWALLSVWYDHYTLTDVLRASPGLRFEWGPAWAVTGRVDRVHDKGTEAVYGWSTRLYGPLPFGASFFGGFADAPETVAGATVATRTVFAGVSVPWTESISLNAGYTRDDRENAYIRHATHAGITQRF